MIFNGTYYTIRELSFRYKRTGSIITRWVKRLGITPVYLGRAMLFTEEHVKRLDAYDATLGTVSLVTASLQLGGTVVSLAANLHLVPHQINERGEQRFLPSDLERIREEGMTEGQVDWEKVKELFKEQN